MVTNVTDKYLKMKIHILGICGTFMGGLAQILVEKGHTVSGSDKQFYPPMWEPYRFLRQVFQDRFLLPLNQNKLRQDKWYWREIDKLASTEFTFTRFLVPALANYKGWALFCDSDIVFLKDVKELFDQAEDKYAVMCVQHDYTPKPGIKMDGQKQTLYPRKNWSSMVLYLSLIHI